MKFGELSEKDIIQVCATYDYCRECPLNVLPGTFGCCALIGREDLKNITFKGETVEDLMNPYSEITYSEINRKAK